MPNSGLPKLNNAIAKAWREALERPCPIKDCSQPSAGIIETLAGPAPICVGHIPGARARGYTVHLPDEPDPVAEFRPGMANEVARQLREEFADETDHGGTRPSL